MKTALPIPIFLALASLGCVSCNQAGTNDSNRTISGADTSAERVIFQFTRDSDLGRWEIQDDVVMGGRSQGRLTLNDAGNALFSGLVSLENEGGFSSVQHSFDPIDVSGYRAVVLRLKGDGKRYQLRIEADPDARHSYASDFQTSGVWQTVEIPFANLYAIHHGDRLDLPNYPGQSLAHIQILVGNGKPESFQLEIDRIWLK